MRALRVVGITEGGDVVLEDPGRRERFTVPADEQLRAASRGDLTRLGQIAIELESQLRPREIQARIRAGASVEQVASAAGVPIQKIERFAYPVLLERSRTAEVAQRAHPVRGDGPDVRTLGDVVAHTFGLRGQEYAEAEWDSWKGEDGKWLVALSWRAGRSDNRAHWTFQPGAHGGTVTSVDEHASDLVEGLPARPLRPVGPVIDIARPEEPAPAPQQPAELRATASDAVRERAPMPEYRGRSSAGERTVVDQGAGESSTETSPPLRNGFERTIPRQAAPPVQRSTPPAQRQAEPEPPAPQPAVRQPAAQQPATQPTEAAAEIVRPPAEPASTEPREERPEPTAETTEHAPATPGRRTKKGKPVMPSWDEVLLGVRGQR